MIIPRLANTKPIFAFAYANLIVAGRHIVMPTPTAAPCKAAMVGLEHWWIAKDARPPLLQVLVEALSTELHLPISVIDISLTLRYCLSTCLCCASEETNI